MSRRTALVIAALAVTALSTALLLLYVRGADTRASASNDTVQVLVATARIPEGTKVDDAMSSGAIALRPVPRDLVPVDKALNKITSISGLRAASTIYAGDVILPEKFAATPASRLGITGDKLAMSVKLDDASRVAGSVEMGSQVAVFVTTAGSTPTTKLLLPRVQVLKVGGDGTGDASLVTFALDQQQAEQLMLAQSLGTLSIALLTADSKTALGNDVTADTLFGQAGTP